MAPAPAPAPVGTGWFRGRVKAVPSGDSLLIMAVTTNNGIPPEKTITLSSLVAPKLARWDYEDEPFAWDSREYLRKLCIGQMVTFKVDYIVPSTGREFGSVFISEKNVAVDVVSQGWAKVQDLGQHKEASPYLQELLRHQEQAKQQGLGRWNKSRRASVNSIRNLPPSAISGPSNIDALGLLDSDIGVSMQGIVEHVRDGSTVRLYLLPEFQFVQVLVAGIQSPSMGRRGTVVATTEPETTRSEANGAKSVEKQPSLTTAQKLTSSTALSSEVPPSPFGKEAKHFTEIRVLNREVRVVLEGLDKYKNLVGSLYYPDGDSTKNLALELVENGLAKYMDWSANLMEEDAKRNLKNAELKAKKDRLNMWTNYVPPASDSKPVHENFKGKVVEIISGDCIIVADDAAPFGTPLVERRVNLSSIRSPRMSNSRKVQKPSPYAREALEFLRTRLIGRQVQVSLEYTRKLNTSDDPNAESRVMDFGSVFLVSSSTVEGDDTKSSAPSQRKGENVAELLVIHGLATVVTHRDFEVRSNHYDDLLAAELRAISGKKGIHSAEDPPSVHVTDLLTASARQANKFLPFLQRRRLPAIVEYVFSGHRFKLYIPKETCSIAFSLSGVRCPGRGKPYSDEAIGLVRRKILQRDVEIEIETCDRNGTFLGSLWESGTNIGVTLLESGLAKLQTSVAPEKITDFRILSQAEQSAEQRKLKIWENILGDHENGNGNVSNGHYKSKKKEVLKVFVTEVLGGGRFYIQEVEDPLLTVVQQRLAKLNLEEAPAVGSFNPKKGDVVLAKFSYDDSWNRALVVNTPQETATSKNDRFEVFYIDYGTQEVVTYDRLRPVDAFLSSSPGLAQLCSLAYVKVPNLKQEFGRDAAKFLSEITLDTNKQFRATVERQDTSREKVTGQGTGPILYLTLKDKEFEDSINEKMLLEGFARVQRRKRRESKDTQEALDELEKYQDGPKRDHLRIWQYGDIGSDDDENVAPAPKKAGGRK